MKPIVVIYYSRTGKTRAVATKLAAALDADIEELTEKADRSGVVGWFKGGLDATLGRPADLTSTHDLSGRTTVILGYPVWAFAPPPAMRQFVTTHDLAGKKVCAFCTYEGSGAEKSLDRLAELVPGGLAVRLEFKKVKPDDPALDEKVAEAAENIKG
jgi:flavodoxin